MPTLTEMTAWSDEETLAEIQAALPPGWAFKCPNDDGYWVPAITDEQGVQVWGEPFADLRTALLSAFMWLWTRGQPENPRWTRRRELHPHAVAGAFGLPHVAVPDPPDLDPAEVQAVYDDFAKRR